MDDELVGVRDLLRPVCVYTAAAIDLHLSQNTGEAGYRGDLHVIELLGHPGGRWGVGIRCLVLIFIEVDVIGQGPRVVKCGGEIDIFMLVIGL